MRRNTLSITHGAITAALSVLIILGDRIVAGFIMPFIPLPLIVYGLYYPMKQSIITYVSTVFLVMMVPGQLPTTILMMTYGLVALVYIAIFKTKINKYMKVFVLYLANLLNYFLMMTFFGQFFGLDLKTLVLEIEMFFEFITKSSLVLPEATLYNLALVGVMGTVAMETFIIYLSATQLTYFMKRHRK